MATVQESDLSKSIEITAPKFRSLSLSPYSEIHQQMRVFTDSRDDATCDEIWFVQHEPVFTLGRNQSRENILTASEIPIVQSDRGGDVTYHGPGQLIIYCLFDLQRLQLGVKALVADLEELFIQYLAGFDVVGQRIESAPGVYVDNKKIASLGLRVRKGCSFHGMAINVDMDLTPFSYIHPCGLEGMRTTQLADLGIQGSCDQVASDLSGLIVQQFYR